MSAQYKLVRFNLNGKEVEKMVDVRASLTDMLRNDFRMTSVKKGCEVGECGACNVLIDGEAFNSCIYLAIWAGGKKIQTLESLLGPGALGYSGGICGGDRNSVRLLHTWLHHDNGGDPERRQALLRRRAEAAAGRASVSLHRV